MSYLGRTLTAMTIVLLGACSNGYEIPKQLPGSGSSSDEKLDYYGDEAQRVSIPKYYDMVLAYGGSPHRKASSTWDTDRIKDYLLYEDQEGGKHLLFDAFLFLEFMYSGQYNGVVATERAFTDGYGLNSAHKEDWQALIDYYFEKTGLNTEIAPLDALEQAYAEVSDELGLKDRKLGVVIFIPEPIMTEGPNSQLSVYWGNLNGEAMNFHESEDRIQAVKWYVDSIRERFYAKNYRHIELGGFYWVAETASTSSEILKPIGDYLSSLKYSFNWIPYFGAEGYYRWAEFGFNTAYLQPNYFFNLNTPVSQLDDACQLARKYNMNLEMEFDDTLLNDPVKADRLRSYMKYFKEYGAWETQNMAYYVGDDAVRNMKYSTNDNVHSLYYEFCDWLITRPVRKF